MRTLTYKHTYTYLQTHTQKHTYTYLQTHTHTYKHTHTYLQTHTQKHTYTYLQTHTHTYKHTHTYLQTHAHKHTHRNTRTHTYKHSRTHLQIHARTQILYIQAGVAVMLFTKCMVWTFFGVLRAAEIEHLIEKLWYTVTETCLSFTVFRDDFSPKFVGLFTVLLVLKCFHWLAEDRVDYVSRRLSNSLISLVLLPVYLLIS